MYLVFIHHIMSFAGNVFNWPNEMLQLVIYYVKKNYKTELVWQNFLFVSIFPIK